MRRFFPALALLVAALSFAQDHNSAEHHRQWNPQHAGYDGVQSYSGRVIHIPNEVWINYHGALAWNLSGEGKGISENARSERAARREALRKCGERGCKIAAYTRNGCLAAAYGNGSTVGAASTKEEAEQRAMSRCQADGSVCQITYSHCNHPVRIR